MECCTAVRRPISEVPLPRRASVSPLLRAAGLLPGDPNGKRFGLQDWQPAAGFEFCSLVTKGTVGPGEAGTNDTLCSSEFTGDVLRSSGGQRWAGDKRCGANSLLPLHLLTASAPFDSTLLESDFLCRHLIRRISKEENRIPVFF